MHYELNMLTRLLTLLFHLFASIVGHSLLIPDGGAQLLRSGSEWCGASPRLGGWCFRLGPKIHLAVSHPGATFHLHLELYQQAAHRHHLLNLTHLKWVKCFLEI